MGLGGSKQACSRPAAHLASHAATPLSCQGPGGVEGSLQRAESRTMVLIEMRREGGGCGFGREQQAGVQLTCSAPRVSRVHAAELSRARGGGGRSAGHRAEQWC